MKRNLKLNLLALALTLGGVVHAHPLDDAHEAYVKGDFRKMAISIGEALRHGGIANDARVNLHWVDSQDLEAPEAISRLEEMDAILVAPGFGARGVEGKIRSADFARDRGVPFLGICYGMQMAVIAHARSVLPTRVRYSPPSAAVPVMASGHPRTGVDNGALCRHLP